jgi:AhpD family alkylhydroperoxidase
MIATYVSAENDCYFCQHAHGAVAAYRLGGNEELVNTVKLNFESAAISEKMKALLAIAGAIRIYIVRMAGGWRKWAMSSRPRNYRRSRNNTSSRHLKLTPFARSLLLRRRAKLTADEWVW